MFSTASEKSWRGPLCGPCRPRGRPPRNRVVAEEAEFPYKDLAAVVDMLTASTSPVDPNADDHNDEQHQHRDDGAR
jgi:hypothetical protein